MGASINHVQLAVAETVDGLGEGRGGGGGGEGGGGRLCIATPLMRMPNEGSEPFSQLP